MSVAAEMTLTNSRSLFRFAVFFAVFILLHIKGGAMVTSTGAGMAFTDWPLARGSLWPPGMDLEDYFEHLHRISGALVGLFGIVLLVWVYRRDRRPWVIRSAWGLLFMIIVQGLFGGLGVVMGEAEGVTWAPAAVVHGVFAQPTLCLAVLIAFFVSPAWHERVELPADVVRGARKTAWVAVGLILVQLVIGATVRHTNSQSMLWLHVFMALAVSTGILIASAYAVGKVGPLSPSIKKLARWSLGLLFLQLLLGFVTLGVRNPKDPSNIEYLGRSFIVSMHVVTGASLFLFATLLLARSLRNLRAVQAP